MSRSIEEIKALVEENYTTRELASVNWSEMSDTDVQVYYKRALEKLKRLPFAGHSTLGTVFPRYVDGKELTMESEDIKVALARFIMFEIKLDGNEIAELRKQGVASTSVGKGSMSFTGQFELFTYDGETIENVLRKYLRHMFL